MKPEEIKLSDWSRILFGETPPSFYLEVILRTVFVFLLLIISMRLFGRRMAAQVDRIELIALFSLAAAIGVPLQAPDRGLLPAVIIAIVVVGIGRIVAKLVFTNQKLEAKVSDELSIIIHDGVLQKKKLLQTRLTIERVFAQLRSEGIRHLGEVKRLYIEANGSFSLVKADEPAFGLTVLPSFDPAFLKTQKQSTELVCKNCGQHRKENKDKKTCDNCGKEQWVLAVE
ncbi:MAG: hypothetical protein JWR72_335 [Flavisolibacter sp.]|jgi:uncharacterized membrane protein YcaP (DUF421 family)|nr:hypothetical protein [Flavisolibacter sp.]